MKALENFSKYSNETYLAAIRQGYKDSLYHTARSLLGYKDMVPHAHGPIVQVLESETKRKLVVVPRGTFKSSITSVAYPIWLLMNNPNARVMLDSELYTNSKNFLREIKGHVAGGKFIDLFGEWESSVWNESEIIIKPRNKILKDPSILAGGIGTTKVGLHVDYIVGDDYNSPANSGSQELRKKIIEHYRYNQSILELDGVYVIVGTRYAEDDLIGWILKNELGIENQGKIAEIPREGGVIYV